MLQLAAGSTNEINLDEWHDLQSWLENAEHRVVIPYAKQLAESIQPVAVRLRRDFRSILRLIQTHVILHQCNRDRDDEGRIIATEADYYTIRQLIADLISEGVGATVPDTVRETVDCVREISDHEGATVKVIAERLKLDRSATQRRIQSARERGYLTNLEEKRGRPARYTPGDPLPGEPELLPRILNGVQVCNDREGGIDTKTSEEATI